MTPAPVRQPLLVVLSAERSMTLPEELSRDLQPGERFLIARDGDTIVLKRVNAPFRIDVPDDESAPDLDELSDIVHAIRATNRQA